MSRSFALLTVTATASLLLVGCAGDPPEKHIVTVQGMEFTPAEVTVSPGDTVTWVIDDAGRPHDVVAFDGTFQSGLMEEGEYSFTFEDVGTFDYFCTPHPGMEGIVIVE